MVFNIFRRVVVHRSIIDKCGPTKSPCILPDRDEQSTECVVENFRKTSSSDGTYLLGYK